LAQQIFDLGGVSLPPQRLQNLHGARPIAIAVVGQSKVVSKLVRFRLERGGLLQILDGACVISEFGLHRPQPVVEIRGSRVKLANSLSSGLRLSKSLQRQLGLEHVEPRGTISRRKSYGLLEFSQRRGYLSL